MPLRMIPVTVQCVVIASVFDVFLARDAALKVLAQSMQGKVYCIHVIDTHAKFYIGFSDVRVWVHSECDRVVDVEISSTLAGIVRLTFAKEDPDALVFEQVLRLSGDSEAMLLFKRLLTVADIDWERELRSSFGDLFGARIAKTAKAMIAFEQRARMHTLNSVNGYMRKIDIPQKERLQLWQAGVELVSRDLLRLQKRIRHLEVSDTFLERGQ